MPLTPAHAAVVWPVRRVWPRAPVAALAIGAMSPDFVYLLELSTHGPQSQVGHTWFGVIWFSVPVSFVVWLAFRRWVRPMVLDWLPPGLAAAIGPGVSSVGPVVVAMAVGAASHLVWDGFTHEYGWAVRRVPALGTLVWPALAPGLRWYKVLQHGSTLGGGLAIAAGCAAWVGAQPAGARADTPARRRRARRGVAILVSAGLAGAVANVLRVDARGLAEALMFAAIGGMDGLAVTLLVLGSYNPRHPS